MKHYIITKDCTAEFSLDEGQIGKFVTLPRTASFDCVIFGRY